MENTSIETKTDMFKKGIGYTIVGVTGLMMVIDLFTQSHSYYYTSTIRPTWSNLFRLLWVIYYCMLIHKIHKIAANQTNNQYPITPGKAVGFMFIPFFNLYWIFKWPLEMAKYVNDLNPSNPISSGKIVGFLVGAIVIALIPLPIDGNLYWIFGVVLLLAYFHIAISLYERINDVQSTSGTYEGKNQNISIAAKTGIEIGMKEKDLGLLILALPAFALLFIILHTILAYRGYRIVNILQGAIFAAIPIIIALKLKDQTIKTLIIILSSLVFILNVVLMFRLSF
ncbi:MAG: hypothetical protein JXB49_24815 [Bacteroidales bacterium]|nr:hypothetical protein [Bacteroidales bacterium]